MAPWRAAAFKLALALGEPNPDRMLAQMPWRIWQEWQRFLTEEPIGQEPDNLRTSYLATILANLLGRRKGQPPYRMEDFRLSFQVRKAVGPDELLQKILLANHMLGGETIHGSNN